MQLISPTVLTSKANKRGGFTLIEMSVVILVLTLLAAVLYPNIVQMKHSRDVSLFQAGLGQLVQRAREEAIRGHQTIAMTYDDNDGTFKLEDEPTDGTDPRQIAVLSKPQGVSVERLLLGTDPSSASDWRVRFYADGAADDSGVELSLNGRTRSLSIDPITGLLRWSNDTLDAKPSASWPAGETVTRG